MQKEIVVFWFRRDLRLEDNVGLQEALDSGFPVLPIFIFDKNILEKLSDPSDRRVDYFHQALEKMNDRLIEKGTCLHTYYATPLEAFKEISKNFSVKAVYCNRDYEPYAIKRDNEIKQWLQDQQIAFYDFKDQVIFDRSEVVKADGIPYTVFTPYSKKWKEELQTHKPGSAKIDFKNFFKCPRAYIHSLDSIGFKKTDLQFTEPELDPEIINDYGKYRNFPARDRTTHLGIALRFGTISIRKCVDYALKHNETWLNELIWREFFSQILFHFPHVVTKSFKPQYDQIEWRNNEKEFMLWCEGKTGYPIVDAGMHQLNETGFMHNRVRMITASFLCKHLLIDWRWGEAYFAQKLLDYDLSSNNGNWQWAAGSGCDAAPYFRIFNPALQREKFDKELAYIKKWNPDYEKLIDHQIVEHSEARERALATYKKALDR